LAAYSYCRDTRHEGQSSKEKDRTDEPTGDPDEAAVDLTEMLAMKRALSAFLHRKHR
jgi:hypothetical protein